MRGRGRRGGGEALRRGPAHRARFLRLSGANPRVEGAAPCVFRRARCPENSRRPGKHADACNQESRRYRRRYHGRRHYYELFELRRSRDDPRDEAGRARPGRGDHPQELRKLGEERQADRGEARATPGLAQPDLVIEAVFEDIGVKESVFKKLDEIAKPGAILATNTSTLDVNKIASFTKRPQDVIGTHFFSPANVMKLLEVVRGAKTGKDVLATVMKLAKAIKKTAVVSGVCDGFIGNRMVEHYSRQALFLLEEGATPSQVDRALEKWGMAMGPFRMGDLAGNDIGWYIRKRRYQEHPEMIYSGIADRLCELGRFGQKTGSGWYR